MRTPYSALMMLGLLLAAHPGNGQWCMPTSLIPYSPGMPGITRFQLNTIDRASADLEHYPNNNYTNTGLSTALELGGTYPVTIDFTIDPVICPDMNLRVWVDMNHDGQLDDIGETLLSVDHRSPSSYTGTISIPLTAMTGPTRLRVTAKMSNLGGHSLPTPCDFPADQLGYHGEMEDYDVTIVEATGINEVAPLISAVALQPNPATDATMLSFLLSRAGDAWVEVFDATGRRVAGPLPIGGQPGVRSLRIPCGEAGLVNGVYFVQLKAEGSTQVVKLLVDN